MPPAQTAREKDAELLATSDPNASWVLRLRLESALGGKSITCSPSLRMTELFSRALVTATSAAPNISRFRLFNSCQRDNVPCMNGEPLICRYVFTAEEFKDAHRGTDIAGSKRQMNLYIVIVVLIVAVFTSFPGLNIKHAAASLTWTSLLLNLLPLVIILGVFGWFYAFSPNTFRKSPLFNQEVEYTLTEQGFHQKSPSIQIEILWNSVAGFVETPKGYRLYIQGNLPSHWLPKSGFDSDAALNSMQALLQRQSRPLRKA